MNMWSYEEFLEYWFGPKKGAEIPDRADFCRWYDDDRKFDRELRRRFMATMVLAAEGGLDHWVEDPLGCLATVILVDHVSRRIYRGTVMAYDNNKVARKYSQQGIAARLNLQLATVQQIFFYQPFLHSECQEDLQISVELYTELMARATNDEQSLVKHFLDDAIRRFEIIRRFGRFPHRNKVLKRPGRPEEEIFLDNDRFVFKA